MPPPIRNTLFPLVSSIGKPFPRGPRISMVSPGCFLENSVVPAPAILYTMRRAPFSLSISQILIGLGRILPESSQYREINCPGAACSAISFADSHML